MSTHYSKAATLTVDGAEYVCYPFDALRDVYNIERLPFSLKILLENLLRHGDEEFVTDADVEALAGWDAQAEPTQEIAFVPARVLLQDFTGVPAIVDLAVMRDAMVALGGDPKRINPLNPVELVIDHSVMVDVFGKDSALADNTALEVQRNRERYQFLRWGQQAFANFKVVPPGTGIVHQVNLEYLARVVCTAEREGQSLMYPDTLVGTDSHSTMINGLGVLGWGVGGIEAEAAMLGQPVTMLIPQVVGFRLTGSLPEGTTATDLVLTVTQMLRSHGVVGKFVEFFGPGISALSLADRATIANMAPEYGATCGLFPVDAETLAYLRLTGRDEAMVQRVEHYTKSMGLWHEPDALEADYSAVLELDLRSVEASLAGPHRPQDRLPLPQVAASFRDTLRSHRGTLRPEPVEDFEAEGGQVVDTGDTGAVAVSYRDAHFMLEHGAVVIAAITSCTNTSNPAVLIAAGLLARKARQRGLVTKPWVKTSLAPGSQVVTDYLRRTGLLEDLEALGFYLVGYGCTTCIGNSGPLPGPISEAIHQGQLLACSVLSGNRNFEGRIHQEVRANYLASPPLVVAYALAGNLGVDMTREPLGSDRDGRPVYLRELWPHSREIQALITDNIDAQLFRDRYADVYAGNSDWNDIPVSDSERYPWPDSSYVRKPPYFDGMSHEPAAVASIDGARCLVFAGDSVTTDHISPAGAIAADSPAGQYLREQGIEPQDFNSYGSRRGNHEVMMRGTFANVRFKNQLVPGREASWTRYFPDGEELSIFDAAARYRDSDVPLIILAGKEYGSGSSRDWAAKGPALLGVRAVIAESFERIHRSNLIGMGILPLQFADGESAVSLGLDGSERYTFPALKSEHRQIEVAAVRENGEVVRFTARVRIDTPNEFAYYQHGGILHYVLRRLAAEV